LADQCATMMLTQTVTTARGLFAPGHLGALTRFVPFELVDDLLDRPGRRGWMRQVPMRVAVYFVLALASILPRADVVAASGWLPDMSLAVSGRAVA